MKRVFVFTLNFRICAALLSSVLCLSAAAQELPASIQNEGMYNEQYRPQYHFTPPEHWNNDPNGLVYYKGEYHMFYQYFPGGMQWGPMHWGHAVSKDMLHWKQLPVALYPDSIGYIFSGSAVVDEDNTAGFRQGSEKTLVAIFTQHDPNNSREVQSIAYSNDKGRTWKKYDHNPVIDNPGLHDFRDPNVKWYAAGHCWILALAGGDHIAFYSSPNLRDWKKESEFGRHLGNHGGVWECPDLIPMKVKGGGTKWLLMVNNFGSPAGGGSTQYFIGDFDGKRFTPADTLTRWLYGGADEYAGVTWNNTGGRTVFIGWMNNWPGASEKVPSYKWRGGMTLPVELNLEKESDSLVLTCQPIKELAKQEHLLFHQSGLTLGDNEWDKSFSGDQLSSSVTRLETEIAKGQQVTFSLENAQGEHIDISYDADKRQLKVDRTAASGTALQPESAKQHQLDLPEDITKLSLEIYYDRSSVEIFVNHRWMMTDLVFPTSPYNKVHIMTGGGLHQLDEVKVSAIHSVWR